MLRRARKGMRVRYKSFHGPIPRGTIGTIAEYSAKNIYCDAYREMIFVRWDNRKQGGALKSELEEVRN